MKRFDHLGIPLSLRNVDGLDRHDMSWPGRQQHELIGEEYRLTGVVRDQQRRGRASRPDIEQKPPQAICGLLVERHERFIEQKQVGLGGEGPGQRHASG
ncbi:hypothetical protein AUC71_05735 [Methyloceanibacter marginalis]|uniref:Uncharacterized protein n=1 Tax=Methyloceanibacter marginalis TaxID=1774971 RepID=A0A1E3WF24_9HYPH|nr:hypothetical protein [Methyloceanibacter marginalis]ODS04122.1 hypothetical protein AUC71_05735 [Methyloceanibacter marginalis]